MFRPSSTSFSITSPFLSKNLFPAFAMSRNLWADGPLKLMKTPSETHDIVCPPLSRSQLTAVESPRVHCHCQRHGTQPQCHSARHQLHLPASPQRHEAQGH